MPQENFGEPACFHRTACLFARERAETRNTDRLDGLAELRGFVAGVQVSSQSG
jgi:hypothetical protein